MILQDAGALALEGARRVAVRAARVLAARSRFRLVLAGGATPRGLYEQLAAASGGEGIDDASLDWSRVELFFGDERVVPPDDPASNYRMVRESLLDRLVRAPAQVHRIEGELPPAAAAARYARRVGIALGSRIPRFDLVLLGLGTDGHTASLFPGSPALDERARPFVPARAPVAPHDRVTVTLPALRAAGEILFLVGGVAKATALARVLRPVAGAEPLPAARVRPASGRLTWLADEAAAVSL